MNNQLPKSSGSQRNLLQSIRPPLKSQSGPRARTAGDMGMTLFR